MKQVLIAGEYLVMNIVDASCMGGLAQGGGWVRIAEEVAVTAIVTTPGTISNLRMVLSAAPGAGKTWTFAVRKNGVDTALTVAITGTATTGSDTTNPVTVVAGDVVSFHATPTSNPSNALARWTTDFEGTNAGECLVLGNAGGYMSATEYGQVSSGMATTNATETSVQQIVTAPGTLKNLYVKLSAAPGAGKSRTFTIRKNRVDTALAVTVSGTATTGSDTTNPVTVVAGDLLDIMLAFSGAPAPICYVSTGMTFVPTTDGEAPIMSGSAAYPTNSVATWVKLASGFGTVAWTSGNPASIQRSGALTLYNLYVSLTVAPGAGKSRVFTVYNGTTATALTCTISGTGTTGNDTTHTAEVADGDTLTLVQTPSGTPANTFVRWGITSYIAVAGAKCYGLHPGAMAEMLS